MPSHCENPEKHFPTLKSVALKDGAMKGKIALVTGGGTGLGRAIATIFARLGASVAIAARRLDVLEKTAAEIRAETNGVSATQRLSPNAISAVVDIVLKGTLFVTTEVGKRCIQKGQGCTVLSITTPYARHGAPFVVPSAVSKAGVELMTKSLATEWSRYGFRFNVIAPGPIYTEGAFGRLMPGMSKDAAEVGKGTTACGRFGEKEELANLAAFVCSDYMSWMNGAIIDFDGGQYCQNAKSTFGDYLFELTEQDWENVEKLIKTNTASKPSKM